jgi:hypothetical protein
MLCTALFINQAYARNYECTRQINPNRTFFARIDAWQMMRVHTGVQDCVGAPGFQFCVTKNDAPLIDANTVCGHDVDQRWDCETRDWWEGRSDVVETRCARRGIRARLEISQNGQGRLTCYRRGTVEKSIRLGECW